MGELKVFYGANEVTGEKLAEITGPGYYAATVTKIFEQELAKHQALGGIYSWYKPLYVNGYEYNRNIWNVCILTKKNKSEVDLPLTQLDTFSKASNYYRIPATMFCQILSMADEEIGSFAYRWIDGADVTEYERVGFVDTRAYCDTNRTNRKIAKLYDQYIILGPYNAKRSTVDAIMLPSACGKEAFFQNIDETPDPKTNKRNIYRLNSQGGLDAIPLQMPRQSSGRGGGGAMRADNPDEVDYIWSGNNALGIALGLDPAYYQVGPINKLAANRDGYWKANVPADLRVRKTGTAKLMRSEIEYYKRFKDPGTISKKNLPDRPHAPRIPLLKLLFGSFVVDAKVADCYRKKQKEKPLSHGNAYVRLNAGSVMYEAMKDTDLMIDYTTEKGQISSLPATGFANFVLAKDGAAQKAWQSIIFGGQPNEVSTAQEWCHLYGHGDGGQENYDNFVAGSNHCNTEQLAIECGQRKGQLPDLMIKVTAYQLENNGYRAIIGRDSLDNPVFDAPQPLPLGNLIRYKIYYQNVKIFDHVFDAQSESFNYHEFKILQTTVERVIAAATGNGKDYIDAINEKLKNLGYDNLEYKPQL